MIAFAAFCAIIIVAGKFLASMPREKDDDCEW